MIDLSGVLGPTLDHRSRPGSDELPALEQA